MNGVPHRSSQSSSLTPSEQKCIVSQSGSIPRRRSLITCNPKLEVPTRVLRVHSHPQIAACACVDEEEGQ